MTNTSYSGAWLRNAYVDPLSAKAPTASAAHGVDEGDPNNYAYQSPPLTESGPVGDYPGSEWVVTTLGTFLDHTDYQSHDPGPGDQGAARQGYYSQHAATQFTGEVYADNKFPGLPGQRVSPVALERGLNSLAVNNPEGFEPGRQQVNDTAVWRKFFVGERVHDRRVITPNTAYSEPNRPAVPAGQGNVLTHQFVFDSLARSIKRVNQRPQLRRTPEPMSADLETEQAGPSVGVVSPWVVG